MVSGINHRWGGVAVRNQVGAPKDRDHAVLLQAFPNRKGAIDRLFKDVFVPCAAGQTTLSVEINPLRRFTMQYFDQFCTIVPNLKKFEAHVRAVLEHKDFNNQSTITLQLKPQSHSVKERQAGLARAGSGIEGIVQKIEASIQQGNLAVSLEVNGIRRLPPHVLVERVKLLTQNPVVVDVVKNLSSHPQWATHSSLKVQIPESVPDDNYSPTPGITENKVDRHLSRSHSDSVFQENKSTTVRVLNRSNSTVSNVKNINNENVAFSPFSLVLRTNLIHAYYNSPNDPINSLNQLIGVGDETGLANKKTLFRVPGYLLYDLMDSSDEDPDPETFLVKDKTTPQNLSGNRSENGPVFSNPRGIPSDHSSVSADDGSSAGNTPMTPGKSPSNLHLIEFKESIKKNIKVVERDEESDDVDPFGSDEESDDNDTYTRLTETKDTPIVNQSGTPSGTPNTGQDLNKDFDQE